jgi:cation diffusion facilitator family transporter
LSRDPNEVSNQKFLSQKIALRKLICVSIICLIFMTLEALAGYISNSLSILTDAAHMFSDFLAYIISIFSIQISKKSATRKISYGYHRAEVIGAMFSIQIIWGLVIWLVVQAIDRFINPVPVEGFFMIIVGGIGMFSNILMSFILLYQGKTTEKNTEKIISMRDTSLNQDFELKEDRKQITYDPLLEEKLFSDEDVPRNISFLSKLKKKKYKYEIQQQKILNSTTNGQQSPPKKSMNLRAALINVLGDLVQNLGVAISGVVIYLYPNLQIFDPICTFLFSLIVLIVTIPIMIDCIKILMEGTPDEINTNSLIEELIKVTKI